MAAATWPRGSRWRSHLDPPPAGGSLPRFVPAGDHAEVGEHLAARRHHQQVGGIGSRDELGHGERASVRLIGPGGAVVQRRDRLVAAVLVQPRVDGDLPRAGDRQRCRVRIADRELLASVAGEIAEPGGAASASAATACASIVVAVASDGTRAPSSTPRATTQIPAAAEDPGDLVLAGTRSQRCLVDDRCPHLRQSYAATRPLQGRRGCRAPRSWAVLWSRSYHVKAPVVRLT